MALEESQDRSSVARGWEAMSFFVCFLYASKEAVKIASKSAEDVLEDVPPRGGTWDVVLNEDAWLAWLDA